MRIASNREDRGKSPNSDLVVLCGIIIAGCQLCTSKWLGHKASKNRGMDPTIEKVNASGLFGKSICFRRVVCSKRLSHKPLLSQTVAAEEI